MKQKRTWSDRHPGLAMLIILTVVPGTVLAVALGIAKLSLWIWPV